MSFAGGDYFNTNERNGDWVYSNPKPEIINKVRIGNF